MRRRIDLVIEDLRTRADVLNSKVVFASPGVITDSQLMIEAANRLQAIEILENEVESLKKEAERVKSLLKRKRILLE